MNRCRKWFIIISFIICYTQVKSQTDHFVSIGITNNQFPFIGYNYNNKWNIYLMNSMFIREFEAQYIRLLIGYEHRFETSSTELNILPYWGINYMGAYYDMGLRMKLNKLWTSGVETSGEIIPRYDSDFGFHFCYVASINYLLINNMYANAKITNYPEFRKPEKRISLGFIFKVYPLLVKPEISIPMQGDIRTSRVLMSFVYYFKKTENILKNKDQVNLPF